MSNITIEPGTCSNHVSLTQRQHSRLIIFLQCTKKLQARIIFMNAAEVAIKIKLSEPAVMSRWSQTNDFPRFPKSALHEFHQVSIPILQALLAS